jgi:release factor glutamine methyltransferase
MATSETWTIMSIMNWSANYLVEKGIDDAKTVVEWLLCETLECSRMDLYLKFDRPMSDIELGKFRPMLLKCAAKQPVQQVVGNCEFYGLKLAINEHVLIPRPETERLVEEAVNLAPSLLEKIEGKEIIRKEIGDDDKTIERSHTLPRELTILDIGSGSGCISIALAMHIPQAKITAIEKSEEAVKILQRNVNFHNLEKRIKVLHQDIMDFTAEEPFHMIVSNPPYIADNEMPGLNKNVSFYEPHMALSDQEDGLTFYRYFADKFSAWMNPNGIALLEYGGNGQTQDMKAIFAAYEQKIVKDFQQDDRVIIVKVKEA